jgi:hypothetical protein
MKSNEKSRSEKIRQLQEIISTLDETRLDALLTLLEWRPLKTYQFPDSEILVAAESFERYGRGEIGGISAQESVRKLTSHLKKIRKKK